MFSGNLRKMKTELRGSQNLASYTLNLNGELVDLNSLVGNKISLEFEGSINCVSCGISIKKTYNSGYCYKCFSRLPECDICIVKPELCHFSNGTCRDSVWGEKNCFMPHYIYIANSSGIKVGITRETQIPIRWIDQGAIQAVPIIKVSNRLQSGLIEKLISSSLNDKTNWRKMLKNEVDIEDLEIARDNVFDQFGYELDDFEQSFGESEMEFLEQETVTEISYPVIKYPTTVKSMSFDKTPLIEGELWGIKGQYLILDTGVINIRKHSGYNIKIK